MRTGHHDYRYRVFVQVNDRAPAGYDNCLSALKALILERLRSRSNSTRKVRYAGKEQERTV
jgi:hypothetical protein